MCLHECFDVCLCVCVCVCVRVYAQACFMCVHECFDVSQFAVMWVLVRVVCLYYIHANSYLRRRIAAHNYASRNLRLDALRRSKSKRGGRKKVCEFHTQSARKSFIRFSPFLNIAKKSCIDPPLRVLSRRLFKVIKAIIIIMMCRGSHDFTCYQNATLGKVLIIIL